MKVKEIPEHIARQIENFSIPNGDRGDDVAVALRRFYLRVMLCPCMDQSCVQCEYDLDTIVNAWETSLPSVVQA